MFPTRTLRAVIFALLVAPVALGSDCAQKDARQNKVYAGRGCTRKDCSHAPRS